MDLAQLQQLVRIFIEKAIDYQSFRAEFVRTFLCAQHVDAVLELLVNNIEVMCADFDEGDMLELELRGELSVVANAQIIQESGTISNVISLSYLTNSTP